MKIVTATRLYQSAGVQRMLRRNGEWAKCSPRPKQRRRENHKPTDVILVNVAPPRVPLRPRDPVVRRGVAQPGRAPGSGPGGRRFKSSLPDQFFSITCNFVNPRK